MRKFGLLGVLAGLVVLAAPTGAWANQAVGYGTNCDWTKTQTVSQGVDTDGAGPNGDQVFVYAGTGSTGNADTTAVGACAYSPTLANATNAAGQGFFYGGTAEAGAAPNKGVVGVEPTTLPNGAVVPASPVIVCDRTHPLPGVGSCPGAYVVVDGSNANTSPTTPPPPIPANVSSGYIGASNYEDGAQDAAHPSGQDPSCDGVVTRDGQPGSTNSGGCVGLKPANLWLPVPLIICGDTSGPDWNSTTRDGCFIP